MAAWPFADEQKRNRAVPGAGAARWLEANDAFRKDILKLLRKSGPLLSRDIPDTSVVPWQSTGWTGNRNVTQMLEFLSARGEVATTRRQRTAAPVGSRRARLPRRRRGRPVGTRPAASWRNEDCAHSASPGPR